MKLPSFSYQEICNLVNDNHLQLYNIFTDELIVALCWEESLFNNTKQSGGSAVGLGQVEPGELWTLRKYGLNTNATAILANPGHAIEVVSYMLRHLYESQKSNPSRYEALKRYGGYYYDKAAWRLKTINGWEACERGLQAIPSPSWDYPDQVKDALFLARSFPKDDANYHSRLFPESEE